MGVFVIVISVVAYAYPRLRLVEAELPDFVSDDAEMADDQKEENLEFGGDPAPID